MNLQIGDIVKVQDPGYNYSSYTEMAELMGLNCFEEGRPLRNEHRKALFVIVDIEKHFERKERIVCGIREITTGNEYIIQEDGLEIKTRAQLVFEF